MRLLVSALSSLSFCPVLRFVQRPTISVCSTLNICFFGKISYPIFTPFLHARHALLSQRESGTRCALHQVTRNCVGAPSFCNSRHAVIPRASVFRHYCTTSTGKPIRAISSGFVFKIQIFNLEFPILNPFSTWLLPTPSPSLSKSTLAKSKKCRDRRMGSSRALQHFLRIGGWGQAEHCNIFYEGSRMESRMGSRMGSGKPDGVRFLFS